MGVCKICGTFFGVFVGGEESYTGKKLPVCNSCGTKLKEIDTAGKQGNESRCMQLAAELLTLCKDEEVTKIINEYLEGFFENTDEINKIQEEARIQSERMRQVEQKFYEYKRNFKTTTGYNFDGYKVTKYIGIFSGEVVLGTGFMSELSIGINDLLGTTSNTFARKMGTAKQKALENLIKTALAAGANAIIGVDFDYLTFANNALGVSANGTAVVIQREEE